MQDVFIHPTAIVESDQIGAGTRIWAYAHVLPGAVIGSNCNIGDHGFVESGARIGNNVTIKNNVCVWDGITIEDDAFIGPAVAFTNDRFPRSPRMSAVAGRYSEACNWLMETVVERGSSIGANATITPGLRLGQYCMIAAGAVVTRDVDPSALMMGNPARPDGFVCICGRKIASTSGKTCSECQSVLPTGELPQSASPDAFVESVTSQCSQ